MNIAKWHSRQKQAQQLHDAEEKIITEVHGPSYELVNGSPRIYNDIIRQIRASTEPDHEVAKRFQLPEVKVRHIRKRKIYNSVW